MGDSDNPQTKLFTEEDIGQLVKCTGPDHFLNCIEITLRAPFFLDRFEARNPDGYTSWFEGLSYHHKQSIDLVRSNKRDLSFPLLEIDFPEEVQAEVNAITSRVSRNGYGMITRTYRTQQGVIIADVMLFRLFPIRHVGDNLEILAFGWLANQRFYPGWDCLPMVRTIAGDRSHYTHNSTVRGLPFRNYELTRANKGEVLRGIQGEIQTHDGTNDLYDIRNWDGEQCRLFRAVEARRGHILTKVYQDLYTDPNSVWWKQDMLPFQDLSKSMPSPNTGYYVLMQSHSMLNNRRYRLPNFTSIRIVNHDDEFVDEKSVATGALVSYGGIYSAFEIPESTIDILENPSTCKLQKVDGLYRLEKV